MRFILTRIIMANLVGIAQVQPCLHIPINPSNLSIEVVLEYGEWYANDRYMRFIALSAVEPIDNRTSRHCFGPYTIEAGTYVLRAELTKVGQAIEAIRTDIEVVGDRVPRELRERLR